MALTSDRPLKDLENGLSGRNYGTPGNAQFYFGQLLMMGSDDGLIKPVSGSTVTVCVGVSNQTAFNVTPTTPLPSTTLEYRYGCFDFKGDASITSKTLPGTLLFAVDDQTLSAVSSSLPVAGRLVQYQSDLQFPVFAEVTPLTAVSGTLK